MAIESKLLLTDLKWSGEGDFIIENGDLADTSINLGAAFIQEVQERVKSSTGDWGLQTDKGANMDDFIGETINKELQTQIEDAIVFSLTKDLFLDSQDFVVTAAPISTTQLAVRIDFDTSLTNLVPDSTILLKIVYDTSGKGPFIIG